MHINMLDAKTQLSRLVEAALRGEEVIIANRGKPMVRLVPADAAPAPRAWGVWEGLLSDAQIDAAFSPDADAALAAELLGNIDRRALRVAEPAAAYRAVVDSVGAGKTKTAAKSRQKPVAKPRKKPA